MQDTEIEFIHCDFDDKEHQMAFFELLNEYMLHPMGCGEPFPEDKKDKLLEELGNHPSAFVLFVKQKEEFAGMATCFINYSTFKAAYFINIHDFVITKKHQNRGLGKALLNEITAIAKEEGCCKVNLEVRDDNNKAMALYSKTGFGECEPPMKFWELKL
ncbi:GNAT family N-acetyltransferase [Alkalitalea saponilacus]|uniref:Acetyltransferase (GNAT) family protein n=1 Tax=Alkalitalea saponilacus TaxID=889453 RepID=A0A1T5GQM9_9BACT|nr:GNAT family N-acetyltransferase [Alkalitalea saponilacus]ASB48223.1 GNAT family N-acetyltransferase [Alkalitalea saponilacus]SKC10679.1 Acetyltransferase (GNAT) family protein [Alkalitalea saponilacus]